MLESIEYIDISGNPIIDSLDIKNLNEYFYILNSENIDNEINNDDKNDKLIDFENRENFDKYSLEEIKKLKAIEKSMRIKANNSRIIICKIK